MIRHAFLESAEVAAALLREPVLAERWPRPSALPDFSTGGLARHLANQVIHSVTLLGAEPGASAIAVLEHFTGNGWVTSGVDSADNVDIRHRSERAAAATTPERLAGDVDAALSELRVLVPAQPADRIVDLGEWGLTVDDFLLTRVLELVVHADDLAVTLGLPTPPLPDTATEATIQLLSRIAAWRHGPLTVVRALARRERAPASIAAL
ncbi:maleylpyruvate isomerase N-terminal domain-containing protein [Actinoplanes sp. NPDC051346]|uniref:maleylpyruvate isomerase N-terminal domain-containing protein n=1 Tax=Actinoplanes sp. NPDC051346 TaxID=3155048 RepID=UPI00342E48CB